MICRILKKQDLLGVVNLHCLAFKDYFLTQLGNDFLKLYYNCLINEKNAVCLGAFNKNGLLVGFSFVALRAKRFNFYLILKNLVPFILFGVKLTFLKPKSLLRLVNNLNKISNTVIDDRKYSELLSLGVDPKMQGIGIGKFLLTELEETIIKKGCERIVLTTDFFDNTKTIKFYSNLGYEIFYVFVAYPERKMYKMIKTLK